MLALVLLLVLLVAVYWLTLGGMAPAPSAPADSVAEAEAEAEAEAVPVDPGSDAPPASVFSLESAAQTASENSVAAEPEVSAQIIVTTIQSADAVITEARPQVTSPPAPIETAIPKTVSSPPVSAKVKPEPLPAQRQIVPAEPKVEVQEVRPVLALTAPAQDQKVAGDALRLIRQGRGGEAYRLLVAFIGATEVDARSRAVLVNYLLQQERLAEAGDFLLPAPVDSDPDLRQLKARWLVASKRPDEALSLLEQNRPDLAGFSDYHALLASYYQQFGQPEKATLVYRELLTHDERVADWWAGLALALDRTEHYEDARVAYHRALAVPGLRPALRQFVEGRLAQF
jgi:hypothetical protein